MTRDRYPHDQLTVDDLAPLLGLDSYTANALRRDLHADWTDSSRTRQWSYGTTDYRLESQ